MESSQRQLVNKFTELLYRRKILIIVLFLLSLPVGLIKYTQTPKTYQATSLLSYQQNKISQNKLSPDASSNIRDIVSTLSQIVTSRTNLEKMIVRLDLYPGLREKVPTEDVIEMLRRKIKIAPSRGGIFTISYTDSNPDKVAVVTNEIASKFVEENLKYRQEKAIETSSYANEELQMARKAMDKQENAMRDYKLKYYNEMPNQRGNNMSALASLQGQYQNKQDSIQELGKTLILLQEQLENRKATANSAQDVFGDFGDFSDFDLGETDEMVAGENIKYRQLEEMKASLDSLLMRYTEKHPDVRRVRKIIANLEKDITNLEKDIANQEKALAVESDTSEPSIDSFVTEQIAGVQIDQSILDLERQQKNIELDISNLQQEKEQLKDKIKQYEQWIEGTPVREAEWSSLTREYNQYKRHYDYLVARDLEAKSMLNLERQQKGSQFRIEDPARYPVKPISPNFLLIIGMSAFVGLGVGVGLTLGLDFLDSSFRDPEALESALGVPLLTTIPHIETEDEHKKDKEKQRVIFILLILLAVADAAMFGVAWVRDYIVI